MQKDLLKKESKALKVLSIHNKTFGYIFIFLKELELTSERNYLLENKTLDLKRIFFRSIFSLPSKSLSK